MADQPINGLPVKTTPQTGDKVLISGASEEYLMLIEKLADAVLDKLTSKTFALEQGNMTLLAALNALNSKTKKKTATCVLPEGFVRQAGHSYVIGNLLFINEVIKVTKTVPKGEDIVSDIIVDDESIDANIAYGLASMEGIGQPCCRLIGNKIVYSTGDVTPGYIVLVVIASLKQS